MKNQYGLSLLELLVAMTVLSVSLGVLYSSIGGSTRIIDSNLKFTYAAQHLRSLNNYWQYLSADISQHERSGVTEDGFTWIVTVNKIDQINESYPLLFEIIIVISWVDGQRNRSLTANSVIQRPRESSD